MCRLWQMLPNSISLYHPIPVPLFHMKSINKQIDTFENNAVALCRNHWVTRQFIIQIKSWKLNVSSVISHLSHIKEINQIWLTCRLNKNETIQDSLDQNKSVKITIFDRLPWKISLCLVESALQVISVPMWQLNISICAVRGNQYKHDLDVRQYKWNQNVKALKAPSQSKQKAKRNCFYNQCEILTRRTLLLVVPCERVLFPRTILEFRSLFHKLLNQYWACLYSFESISHADSE